MSDTPLPDILQHKLNTLPTSAGVYQFFNAEGSIIYVGKAKNLRSRVRSYFQERGAPDPKRDVLVSKIADLELTVTDSEVEALLLENNLIKEHAPRYNIRLKDDKSYPYIVITNEPFPRIFPTRRVIRDGSRYFGPYSDVKAMHLMLRTIRGIFPIRSCDYRLDDEMIARRKVTLCLDYHIRKCQGPCEALVSGDDYRAMIAQVEQLLKGKTRVLRQMLEEEMRSCAERLEFEKAADLRNRLQALQTYQDKQKVASNDFKDRDVIALARKDADAVGMVFRIRDGKVVGKQSFTFTGADVEEEADIVEHLLHRYYSETLDIPPEILLGEELDGAEAVSEWLRERAGMRVSIVVPKIGDKQKLHAMCAANARFLLNDILLQKMKTDAMLPKSVEFLQRDLHLPHPPRRIECFDISHFQGAETVASMVSFLDGKSRRSEYRKFAIATVEGVDDFASMREVVSRRYTRVLEEGTPLPDLVVIDGGKGQLSSAVAVLRELGLGTLPVIGLAKRLEEVFVPGEKLPMNIPKTSPGLRLLQRIRDEAHRFAITYHRERRSKATLQTELEQIDGVGPKRAQLLLSTFGSVRGVQDASVEALAAQIGWSAAKRVHAWFHPDDDATELNEDATELNESAGNLNEDADIVNEDADSVDEEANNVTEDGGED